MYEQNTEQWIEVGRNPDSDEWFDCVEKVTESYVAVSCDGEDISKFNLQTLERI